MSAVFTEDARGGGFSFVKTFDEVLFPESEAGGESVVLIEGSFFEF